MKKGKIILIEGTDSSGKKTQTSLLMVRLNQEGIPCKLISFPRYHTPTGRVVGQSYLGKEKEYWTGESGWFLDADSLDPKIASLYYAADRRATIKDILKIINSGQNLILDRYYPSNMAHQGGKIENSNERKEVFEWIKKLELDLLELPKEDITIFLHMPTNIAVKLREKRGGITNEIADAHEENIEHLKRAEETYIQLAEIYNWHKIECVSDKTFESLKSPGEIHEEVYNIVKNYFQNTSTTDKKNIYFAGSIRGGREDAEIYFEIINHLKNYGNVLTEHIGDANLSQKGEQNITDTEIHDRDIRLINNSDILVAEVSNPSLGVGYEIAYALKNNKKVLCLYKNNLDKKLSAMIQGSKSIITKTYFNLEDIKNIITEFFNQEQK